MILSLLTTATHTAVLVSAFAILFFLALFCLFPMGLGEVDPDTVDAARLNYDATYDRFYGVINTHTTELNYTRIAFVHSVGRPDGTPVTTVAT